ncbi:hypothetical protein M514_01136 [Trichuris suis]|uniref:Peptidyl-prolyl cis-trans isomerase n=1 Tax=Trichuris suis TaxID=68888 RepID=A0A085ML07_9BILA|nr:hypothetical protein M513_01136 [Trichuris suis]KFD70923.1 hypothetical protein M514_01136 [Trichuris suis]
MVIKNVESVRDNDMAKVEQPILPVDWQEECGRSVVLQVKRIRNILQPKKIISKSRSPKFYYRVDLTDGKSEVVGLVDTPIRGLNTDTPPGSKVRITCPVEYEGNFIFLDKSNTALLECAPNKLLQASLQMKNAREKFLWTKDSKRPPRWVRFGEEVPDTTELLKNFESMKMNKMAVLVETTVGDLVFDLYTKERPRACSNFLKLCKSKYYNFNLFFSIEANFVAQSGDPLGTGRGGESIFRRIYGDQARYFEMETLPPIRHTKLGTLSFVNNGDNMIGSQFFITLSENITYLDEKHCVFGELTEGFETLNILNETICDKNNRPYQEVRIMHTIVLDDPFPDLKGLTYPSRSPSPDESMINTKRIGVDESVVDEEGNLPAEVVEEEIAAREARAKAHVLEMVGDLHFAEEKPAENVLFVCRLNAITTEDDLAIIFGRFGEILSCEIIRDKVTGASLQYAFIEFATVGDWLFETYL